MRLKILLLASGIIMVCGCSSSPKKSSAIAPAATSATPAKVEVPAKVVVPKDEMTCTRGEEKRLLEVEGIQPKGCKLWYSRYETRSSVASSILGNAYCDQVREKIRTKLVDAGFECMTVQSGTKPSLSTSPVSASSEIDAQKKAEPPKK